MGSKMGTIMVADVRELAQLTAELVQQGVCFEAERFNQNSWLVTITSGSN